MERLTQGEIGDKVSSLLVLGVEIVCGNCGRRLGTTWGRKLHAVYDDGSGRCWANDGIADFVGDGGTSTRFGASLIWAERQATKPVVLTGPPQPSPRIHHPENTPGSNPTEREGNS